MVAFVVDGEVLAAVHVVLVGPVAEYLYGGYRATEVDGAKVHPNVALHREALRRAAAAGCEAYSLGLLGGTSTSLGTCSRRSCESRSSSPGHSTSSTFMVGTVRRRRFLVVSPP